MGNEDNEYIRSMYEMFRTEGWKKLIQDLSDKEKNINCNVRNLKDNEDLFFRKGQLDILAFLISKETQVENVANEEDL